jgi:hypothetical protein
LDNFERNSRRGKKVVEKQILFLLDKEFRPDIMGVLRLPTHQIFWQREERLDLKDSGYEGEDDSDQDGYQ